MTSRVTFVGAVVVAALLGLFVGAAGADHGQAHNGETAEISKADGLTQDEVVTVTGIGYAPGSTLTVVQCFVWPAAGPADCELSNYGQFTGPVGDDGTGTVDYTVNVVDGRCDHDNPCFIVISDGIGPDANGVGFPVTFAAADAAVEDPEEPVDEPTDEAAEEPTAEPDPTPEAEPTAAPEEPADDAGDDQEAAAPASDDDDGGSSAGLIIAIIAIAAVVLGGGWYALRSRGAGA